MSLGGLFNIDNTAKQNQKVTVFTLANLDGISFEMTYGNYDSKMLLAKLAPNNIFSLKIPPLTKVRLYGGNIFDYGKLGSLEIANSIENKFMIVNQLPTELAGKIRSMTIERLATRALTAHDVAMASNLKETFDVGTNLSSFYQIVIIGMLLILFILILLYKS